MPDNVKNFNIGNTSVEIFGVVSNQQQMENIEKSINKAFDNFNAAFYGDQECNTAQKINIYASNTEDEYKELLKEKGIDSSIKSHKFSALKEQNSKEFDIYFYLNRSGDFAYSTLERAAARALIEGNDVFKNSLTPAFKTGMVDYVAGLDENHNVQDNNEDCRDLNKIIEKNLSPHGIFKSSEAQAEQAVKYLKQEHPEKVDALFKELITIQNLQNSKLMIENTPRQSREVVKNFLSELKNDKHLNSKFLEWTNKQLEQFHQKLAEKFVPKIKSVTTEDGTEIVARYHQDNKIEDIETLIDKTLKNFKDTFCSDEECNIPKKFNVFSFNSENQCKQYLCGDGKKFGKFFVSNDKSGEASIYLYPNKEGNGIETLKAWVIDTVIENNGWDHLPQQIRDGMKNYILDLNDDSYKSNNLNDIKNYSLTPYNIMNEFNSRSYLSGQVMRFLMESKSNDIHELLKSFNGLQIKDAREVQKIVNNFMDKLKNYKQEFSNWTNKQLNQKTELEEPSIQAQEGEPAETNQTQEQLVEGKQDFIDQVMSSSCITDLGIKPECKDKLQDLIKALQECNEKESIDKSEEEVIDKSEGEIIDKPEEGIIDEPEEGIIDEPEEEVIEQSKESISNIFNNFRKTLCNSQECHGVQRVNISTIDGDEFKELTHPSSSNYNKIGYFVASTDDDTVDIKLYVDYEKDSSVLDLGSQTFVNPSCSYVSSNTDYEYGSYCAKAAQVMSFLIQRHPDRLAYFFEDLAKSGCNNGDRIMQELDNHYNSELQTWLVNQELI